MMSADARPRRGLQAGGTTTLVAKMALALLLVAVGAAATAAQEEPIVFRSEGGQAGFPDEDDPTRQIIVFFGGVEVVQGNRRMLGDTLVVVMQRDDSDGGDEEPDAATAEAVRLNPGQTVIPGGQVVELMVDGAVSFEQGEEKVVGARSVYVDNRNGTVTILEGEWLSSLGREPLVVRYDVMRQLSDGVREMEGATFSTCDYAHEHWALSTPWARIVPTPDGRVLHTGWNAFELGGVPVLWMPGLHMNVDRDRPPLQRVGFGSSRKFGTEINTSWGGDANRLLTSIGRLFGVDEQVHGDWELELNNYTRRGVFVQPGWSYKTSNSVGKFFGSYIRDRAKRDELDQPIFDDTRGRIDLQHRTRIDDKQVVDAELSYLSDSGFLEEYYLHESRVGKQQETYINYRNVDGTNAWQALARTRLNDFDTQVEYLPRFEQRTAGTPLEVGFLGDAYFTSRQFIDNARFRAGEIPKRDFDAPKPTQPSSRESMRAGTNGTLMFPVDLADDRFVISAGYDLTGFERSREEPGFPRDPPFDDAEVDESGLVRYAMMGGVEWSRVYSGTTPYESDTWNLDGIRQILEPKVRYDAVFGLNHGSEDLLGIDDTEQLDKVQSVTVGFRHRIQTHQRNQVATVLDTEVFTPFYPNENRDNDGRTTGPITVDMRWRPGADVPGLRRALVQWRALFDSHNWEVIDTFASYSNVISPEKSFVISHDRARDVSEFLTAGVQWNLTPKWSFAVFTQQDLLEDESSREGLILRQQAHRWLIDIEVSKRRGRSRDADLNRDRDDTQFSIRFRPSFAAQEQTLLSTLGRIR